MKTKQLIKLLETNGWYFVRQKGSHMQFKNIDFEHLITVPNHGLNEDLPDGLENSILKKAKLK